MKQIDVRFTDSNIADIRGMIGKKLVKYKCDPFEFTTSVYGIVGIAFEDTAFAFTNRIAVMDYYGAQEDVALFKMEHADYSDIKSLVQDLTMVETPVDNTIAEVQIVNELQRLYENDVEVYEVWVTRGVIFKFVDGYELSLEKDIWFSEDIAVEKGYDLIKRFAPTTEFGEGWSGDYRGECLREIISIK